MFTERLAAALRGARRHLRFGGTPASSIATNRRHAGRGVEADGETVQADAYVMALGSYSARWMRKRLVPIPVYPVKGYSITVPITDADAAPVSTVMDETYKVAITRLGDRIRVGGTAEISGFDLRLHESRRAHAGTFGRRPVSGRRPTLKASDVLVRPAADDAGRPAADRADALQESLSQHRPRHARLDHGLRLGQGAGRHHLRPGAGYRRQPTSAWNATARFRGLSLTFT